MYFFFFKFIYASVWWCSAKKSAVYIWVFFSFSFNSWQVCKILWYLRNVKNYQLKFVFYKPEIALMVSKKICFYVSKIKNNVNYKWLRERERERARTISMLSLNLWCMLSVKILINVIDTNDAKLQSMSSSFPYRNMILTCHKPRHFYLRFIFYCM